MTSAHAIRAAILAAPFELDNRGETPHPGTLYIQLAHRKALARDAVLVVGARGVGKSFWTPNCYPILYHARWPSESGQPLGCYKQQVR